MPLPLRVLIVEDSEDDTLLVVRELRRAGYDPAFERVDTAEGFSAALAGQAWDAVIADYSLPRFSGLAALKLLQQSGLDLPFILVSGTIGEDIAVAAMKAGAHDYVLKGNLARLGPAVRRELREAEERRAREQAEQALQRRTALLEALRQVSLELTAELDLATLLHSIVSRAIELLEGTSGGLYLYRPGPDLLEWTIGIGPGLPPIGSTLRPGEGVCGKVWETGKPVIVSDYWRWEGRSPVFDGLPNVASVGALVRWGDESLGVLNVLADVSRPFSSADAELLSLFATQAAIAIRNARLYEDARQRAERLAVVNRVTTAVGGTLHLGDLLQTVYLEIASIFQADAVFVALYDGEAKELDFLLQVDEGVQQPSVRQPLGLGLTSLVVARKKPLLVRDLARERGSLPEPQLWGTMKLPASWLGVPMQIGERLVGVISVQAYQPHAYDEEDQLLLSTIADQVAVAVEQARLYQTLRESEERYRTLFEQANDAVFLETLDGRILDVNERACQLLGYERQELMNLAVADIVPPEVREMLPQLIQQEKDEGGIRIEAENVRKDGSRVAVEVSTTLLEVGGESLVLALGHDITERKRAEQLLQALNEVALAVERALTPEEIFATLGEEFKRLGFSYAVFLTDESQTRLFPRYMSYEARAVKVAEKLLGVKAGDFPIPVEAVGVFKEVIHQGKTVFAEGEGALQQALPNLAKRFAGQVMKILQVPTSIQAPLIVENRIIGLLSVQSDDLTKDDIPAITAFAHQMAAAWRKAQLLQDLEASLEELKRTQAQFLQAQKMEAVGRLAGGVAHDLNNLLTVIQFSIQLIERQLRAQDPLWEYVRQIQEASERATRLTRQLLIFSRRDIVEPQIVNLSQLVGDLSKMLRRIIGEDIELLTSLPQNLRPVRINPSQMEQVIVNLVVNARDAMPRGGRLTIETANAVLDEAYAAHYLDVQPGDYVLLTVSDTGVGMDDRVKAHLFEPFFTTKERGKGTGLGLATVFGIVKQNEGHIWVDSEIGRGTIFKIYLPRARQFEALSETPSRSLPVGLDWGTETILLVEDDLNVRELTTRILETHGYRVLAAESGPEALQTTEEHDGPIHLLLTDVVLPQMSGQELARLLQSRWPGMRVLYMSGYSDDLIAGHGVLGEGVVLLSKPFTMETLLQKVRILLDTRP